jgi:hypothetical protein
MLLYEEIYIGVDEVLPLLGWERNFVPTSLRNSLFASSASPLLSFCPRNIQDPLIDAIGPSILCMQMEPIVAAGCNTRFFGYAALAGEPRHEVASLWMPLASLLSL